MSSDNSVAPARSHHVSRRTVMKAGAHVAWSVPLIQVVTAGPAAASVITPAADPALAFTATSRTWSGSGVGNTRLKLDFTLTNSGAGPTSSLSVTLTFPEGWTPSIAAGPSAEWTTSQVGSSNSWTFTAIGSILVGESKTFSATFEPRRVQTTGTVSLTANYGPGNKVASGQITL